jgi:3-dehydroquinate synthase
VTESDLVLKLLHKYRWSRHVLLADKRVYGFHGELLAKRLRAAGLTLTVCLVPPAETSKSANVYLGVVDKILKAGIDKGSHILTLGGGVVNNLGGFIAATLYRGIGLIHLPSSLMAQIDAAIDFRQAINHFLGKNLIGCIYAPRAILVDPQLLCTLSLRHMRSGIAEAIKHSLTQSPSLFRFLVENADQIRELAFLEAIVRKTIRLKVALMNSVNGHNDGEFLLQYGHCIGHALETVTRYALLHGEAIAIGMQVSASLAVSMNISQSGLIMDHRLILSRYNLPDAIPQNVSISAMLDAIAYDKNILRNTPRIALLENIGRVHRSKEGSFTRVSWPVLRKSLLRNQTHEMHRRELCI